MDTPPAQISQSFVLDGSVALAWFFADEASAYADAVARRLAASSLAVVPVVWPLEIANALLVGERRKRCISADVTRWIAMLAVLPIKIEPAGLTETFGEALRLARTHQLSSYDASYLELAVRLALPIATLDTRLERAAVALGVQPFDPGV